MKLDDWLPDDSSEPQLDDAAGSAADSCWGDAKRTAARLRRAGLGRMALDLLLEILLVWTVLKVYNLVRNQFGSVIVPPSKAHDHALKVIGLEKTLGYFWEQRIQAFFLQWPDFVRFWNVYYWVAHGSNTIGALLALFFIRPHIYQRARTALLLMNCIAIIGYALFPLMPPRLVPDCATRYGGCDKDYSFVDSMDTLGGIWSWRGKALEGVSNHYAAMPSMHFGYALWVCTALAGLLKGGPFHPRSVAGQRAMLALIALYPASVLFCIIVTANHYFTDAMAGATVVGIAYFLASHTPQFGRGAAADWGPRLHWVTGPNSSVVLVAAVEAESLRDAWEAEDLPLLVQPAKRAWRDSQTAASGGSGGGVTELSTIVVARDEAVVLSSYGSTGGSTGGGGLGGSRSRSGRFDA